MSSTFCVRNYDYYMVELDRLVWRMCCHTTPRTMNSDADWYNGSEMQERRHAASNNIKHKDCHFCWKLEDSGFLSPRHHSLKTYENSSEFGNKDILEIKLSNICDLACRYCDAPFSSIWAQRKGSYIKTDINGVSTTQQYDKKFMSNFTSTDDYKKVFRQFVDWLNKEMPRFVRGRGLTFTGGEPFLDDNLYELIEQLDIKDTRIVFNTNINTPENKWKQQTNLLQKLIAKNNTVMLRCSIDGIGAQQEWQRQGSDWNLMKENWLRLGSLPLTMGAALTVTPLTLESMCGIGSFVRLTSTKLNKNPIWFPSSIVNYPKQFCPIEWFSSFKKEIEMMLKLVRSDNIVAGEVVLNELNSWFNSSNLEPSIEAKNMLISKLDEAEKLYGGGSWREIYPKVAEIATKNPQA